MPNLRWPLGDPGQSGGPLSGARGFSSLDAHERLSVRLDRSQKCSLLSFTDTPKEFGATSQKIAVKELSWSMKF